MTPAQLGTKVLTSKWTWIILILILIILLSRGPIKRLLAKLQRTDLGNYITLPGEAQLNDTNPRTAELQELGEDLFAAIDGAPGWSDTRPELFKKALAINDTELRYVANYYKQISGGESLREAVDGEWSVLGDSRQRLVAALLKLNL
jgi:hypothetical protein